MTSTSIQLPPLQFDDGGFRVSIITGSSSANATSTTDDATEATPVSGLQPGLEAKPQSPELETQSPEPESKLQPETQAQSEPEPKSPQLEHDSESQPTAEPESEGQPTQLETNSTPESKTDSEFSRQSPRRDSVTQPKPETESKVEPPAEESKPDPLPVSVSGPGPKAEPEPTPNSPQLESKPAPEPQPDLVPESPVLSHRDVANDMPKDEEPAQQPTVPSHPIRSMQAAFSESLKEVTHGGPVKPRLREFDAGARRERLLEQEKDDEPLDASWRYRPGQAQHEVLKLISQISFGVYLLINGMANDNSQVLGILQGHIDEVDEFLEVTLEDLSHATADLKERTDYLKLPMSNVKVFEEMLEDRNYRAEIVEGNEKIDQVLGRMNVVIKQWDDDVDAGLQGTTAFTEWLNSLKNGDWRLERPDLGDIFDAMNGNADGWLNAFDEMNTRVQDMNGLVMNLTTIVTEMEKKAGEVSRKTWSTIPPFTSPTSGSYISKRDTSSMSSPHSLQSNSMSATRLSTQSGSMAVVQPSLAEDADDGLGELPLPGIAPLLPPPRSSARVAKKPSIDAPRLQADIAAKPSPVEEVPEEEKEDGPLYMLQPRTYTPQPPEPLPSPLVRDSPTSSGNLGSPRESAQAPIPVEVRTSIRGSLPNVAQNRSSSRASPVIKSPHRSNNLELRDSSGSNLPMRDSAGSNNLQARDSSGSDMEAFRQHRLPRVGSHAELGQPARPSMIQSANSDYQHYHPVRASPHSPLQQRPHTAAGPQSNRPSGYFPNQARNQPSRLGSMASMSTLGSEAHDTTSTVKPAAPSVGGKGLKKKKSAFGWFKKAFTMDDEERAAFEARKNMNQADNNYYKDKSPKFLDGRRMR